MKKRRLRSWLISTPPLAAKIGTSGRGADHVGLSIGRFGDIARAVAHNKKGKHVVVEPIELFAPDGFYWVEQRTPRGQEAAVIARILRLAGRRRRYNLWSFNCEHATSWAQNGIPSSPQLDGAFRFALILGGLAIVAHAVDEGD
jgi:hypothetical protein